MYTFVRVNDEIVKEWLTREKKTVKSESIALRIQKHSSV